MFLYFYITHTENHALIQFELHQITFLSCMKNDQCFKIFQIKIFFHSSPQFFPYNTIFNHGYSQNNSKFISFETDQNEKIAVRKFNFTIVS